MRKLRVSVPHTVTNENLRLAMRELVEIAKRTKNRPANAPLKQVENLSALRIIKRSENFPKRTIFLSNCVPTAHMWLGWLGMGNEIGTPINPISRIGDARGNEHFSSESRTLIWIVRPSEIFFVHGNGLSAIK